MSFLRLGFLLGIVAAAAWRPTTAAAAQTNTGEIVGIVRDLTGAPVRDVGALTARAVHLRDDTAQQRRRPGYASLDAGLAKTWSLGGTRLLEFRWDVFNVFNRANFDLPNRIFGNANFGRIFSAKAPREMQLGLRLIF